MMNAGVMLLRVVWTMRLMMTRRGERMVVAMVTRFMMVVMG